MGIAADSRHPWVHNLLQTWADVMQDDKLWVENLGYYFAWEQKVLTNEIWKATACGQGNGTVRLLDIDNVRFCSVTQYDEQPYKDGRFSLAPNEKFPWAGYAYPFCTKAPGDDYVAHPCNDPKFYAPDGWREFAQF